jgi:hypothetical protein
MSLFTAVMQLDITEVFKGNAHFYSGTTGGSLQHNRAVDSNVGPTGLQEHIRNLTG